jgi:hypothetical protein
VSKHTSGPWRVESDFTAYSVTGPAMAPGYNGCFANEADAHLIAAAPELISCLRDTVSELYQIRRERNPDNSEDYRSLNESTERGLALIKRLEIWGV